MKSATIGKWLCALLMPTALMAQDPAPRDWSKTLKEDAQAFHDELEASHPGPANAEDPGFRANNSAQLALALQRSHDAQSYGDYFYAMRQYVSSFDDGHMGFGAFGNTPNIFHWPGFFTDYDGQGQVVVVHRTSDADPPLGAQLLRCDGMSAEQYAEATVGKMWGRWQLESQRRKFGKDIFLAEKSQYIPQAKSCTFAIGDTVQEIELDWKPLSGKEFFSLRYPPQQSKKRAFESRVLADGSRWYQMPSFNGHPESDAGKALPDMIANMNVQLAEVSAPRAIILDLRGNGGGSSHWSGQIAKALWGEAVIKRLPSANVYVEWRASKANLDYIEQTYKERNVGDAMPPDVKHWYETVISGLGEAVARGQVLWRHPSDKAPSAGQKPNASTAKLKPLKAPVYMLTDENCGSACLDAVDLWLALGAIHVGRTTSADTLYMETRRFRLPSGITGASIPMKVYRGRLRGSNVPAVPKLKYEGEINDTEAVEKWISSLQDNPQ